jgi:hypothetical protein
MKAPERNVFFQEIKSKIDKYRKAASRMRASRNSPISPPKRG